MTEPKLLSREELEETLSRVERGAAYCEESHDLRAHIAALEKERDAAVEAAKREISTALLRESERDAALADNAALVAEMSDVARGLRRSEHRHAMAERLERMSRHTPHPGAALLEIVNAIRQHQRADEPDVGTTFRRLMEERGRIAHMVPPDQHAKALTHARNEGRNQGLEWAAHEAEMGGFHLLAETFRAAKWPEPTGPA